MKYPDSFLSIFLTFLRFGLLAWGGPVAQIEMIREELVEQKQWIDAPKFKRALALYQALPGPEAHEMCVYLGMVRGGRIGGLLAGIGFMLPGLLLMLFFSWIYVLYGSTLLLPLFIGVTPVVAALVIRAVYRITTHVAHSKFLILLSFLAVIFTLLHMHFIWVLAICGTAHALGSVGRKTDAIMISMILILIAFWFKDFFPLSSAPHLFSFHALPLFKEGLKAGLFSFGGAYTVIPFLQESMIEHYPHITQQAFLDGLALTHILPAPLVILATYLGFLAEGVTGALWISLGIFLPAFLFTLLGHRPLEYLMEYPALHGLLEGVAAGVVGLFIVSSVQILEYALTDLLQIIPFIGALTILFIYQKRWLIPVLVLAGGVWGYSLHLF